MSFMGFFWKCQSSLTAARSIAKKEQPREQMNLRLASQIVGGPELLRQVDCYCPFYSALCAWVQFSSVAQFCLTLSDPMDCSMPGLPVHCQLQVYPNSGPLSWWCHPTILCHPLLLPPSIFPSIKVFSKSQFFRLGGQSIAISASTLVLPMNTQDWSPLAWTGWISLQSKGLSRVFSNATVQNHQFFGA